MAHLKAPVYLDGTGWVKLENMVSFDNFTNLG